MNIFTYGSLMVPSIFTSVTNKTFQASQALLSGYERFCLKDDSYPGIIESRGGLTNGVIYLNVDDDAVEKLDRFEGDYYFRASVEVSVIPETDETTPMNAQAYVVKPEYRHILSDRAWDFEEFKNKFQDEFKRKYFGFQSITDS